MNSRSVVLVGRQVPRVACVPAAKWSHADDASFLASSYGLVPDEWQFSVLEAWLGARRNGRWAATTCGLAVPRQNGKNGILEIRELYGMVALGERFLHTAHEVKTARKAFLRLKSFFENERKYPELAALAVEIRKTNGQEAIVLENGGSVEFVARSKGSGRGFTVDVLVCDEAQELSDESLEALGSTISAAPLQNPQTIFTGTPPGPNMNGEVFTRTRAAALSRKAARLAWHEWSLEGDIDLDDRALWAETNPSLGGRLNIEVIEDERSRYSDDGFARERLGVWADESTVGEHAINQAAWRATEDPKSSVETLAAFGVAVSIDRSMSAIGAAGVRADGQSHLEAVDHRRGVGWLVDRCIALDAKHVGATFVIDGGGPAASLIEPLQNSGLTVLVLTLRDVARACAWLVDGTTEKTIFHGPQPELDAAVAAAKWRNAGPDQQVFGRRVSTADISPLEAVVLAGHVLPSTVPLDSVTAAFM